MRCEPGKLRQQYTRTKRERDISTQHSRTGQSTAKHKQLRQSSTDVDMSGAGCQTSSFKTGLGAHLGSSGTGRRFRYRFRHRYGGAALDRNPLLTRARLRLLARLGISLGLSFIGGRGCLHGVVCAASGIDNDSGVRTASTALSRGRSGGGVSSRTGSSWSRRCCGRRCG